MKVSQLIDQLVSMQTPSGAFPSTVDNRDGRQADETCFVTASVVLLLTEMCQLSDASPCLVRVIERGVAFIERCADPDLAGAFRFYPRDAETYQVRRDLPPDADDTALAWMALVSSGARPQSHAAAVLAPLFDGVRVRARARGDAPWVRAGVYRTWLGAPLAINPADICVNANILACRAMAGLPPDPELSETLSSALQRWQVSPASLRMLAPYYAHPDEIGFAMARAEQAGAVGGSSWSQPPQAQSEDQPLYCNSHGRPFWRAPALHRARHLQRALIQSKEIANAPDAAICS